MATNGGPTSLLYKPVFTSIIPPANSTPPSVGLTQPVPPVIQGVPANGNFIAPAAITLTATATPATGSGNTISQVQFYQGSTLVGTATAPTTANGNNYSVNWTNVAANSYSVTAKATDNKSNTASSTPITVNVINNTSPTISLAANPANATAPATIILNATASDTDGTVSQVEFFNGTTSIGVVTQAPFTANWTNVAAGNYNVTARATDNLGASTTSTPAPVTVAAYQPKVYDIYTDQIDTPRVITDTNGSEVWRWDGAPFGEMLPNDQPTQVTSKFRFNFRFPGQYYDSETNLHYNYFRDYDPQAGRYVESDPIGLNGGINTYVYVIGRPFAMRDRFGLAGEVAGNGGYGSSGNGSTGNGSGSYATSWGAGGAVIGGSIVAGGSLVVDAATGGANIIATPAEISAGMVIGGVIGSGLGSTADWLSSILKKSPNGGWQPPPPPPSSPSDRMPGYNDPKGQCIFLYTMCVNDKWRGSCGDCLNKCTAQNEWPFANCKPKKKKQC